MLALYIHWPFCESKCPYCDFNSHVRVNIDQNVWQQALLQEMEHAAQEVDSDKLGSIFFGGGTPSLMAPSTVESLIDKATQIWTPDENLEVTLEANPGSVEAGRFQDYARAGVNRLSIGVQSLIARELVALGRFHSRDEALAAIDLAGKIFDRFSFDLIYARPGQSLDDWSQELNWALSLAGGHISLYQLTIEPGTAFHTLARQGKLALPEEELAGDFYDLTRALTGKAGYDAYEISNYACAGMESRHNLTYWRYGDYIGIGPGAHGRISRSGEKYATKRQRLPESWVRDVGNQGHGLVAKEKLSPADRFREMLMMGLRLREGVLLDALKAESGIEPENMLDMTRRDQLVEGGFLNPDRARLQASESGRLRLNALLAYLLS